MSKRKMLAAEENIANKIVELAQRKGMTVYQTVNDILEQALRVEEIGPSMKELVDERWMLERAREMGLSFTVEHLYYQVIDTAYSKAGYKICELWRDMGHWYGKYFQSKNDDPVQAFSEFMGFLTIGTSEFILEKDRNDQLSISCVGESYSRGFTEVLSLFIEESFEVFGYKISERETSKGILKLSLIKA